MSIKEGVEKNVVNLALPNFVYVTVTHVSTTIGVLVFFFVSLVYDHAETNDETVRMNM